MRVRGWLKEAEVDFGFYKGDTVLQVCCLVLHFTREEPWGREEGSTDARSQEGSVGPPPLPAPHLLR